MPNFLCSVINGKSAGKEIMIGMMSAADLIDLLRNKTISVNENAQRTLGKNPEESTADLLDDDRIENTPRMKRMLTFLKRVMDKIDSNNNPNNEEGFFGGLQLAIPHNFKGARLIIASAGTNKEALPSSLYHVIISSRGKKLGVLDISTTLSETALFIGDGQCRAFGFHSFLRKAEKENNKLKKIIRNKEKKNEPNDEEQKLLLEQEKLKSRIEKFLNETDVSFICYAASVNDDGQILGLSDTAQARLFVEGNALNSQATQDEILRYETISPIIVGLQQERLNHRWMFPEYIEENTKSISKSSSRLFTLSALVQTYSISILGESKPNDLSEKTLDYVGERSDFVSKFWSKVSELFEPVWIPDSYTSFSYSGRSEYVQALRGERHRNVLFQAVFLQALGRLCYEIGKTVKWNEQSDVFNLMWLLSPNRVDYDAVERYQESPNGETTVIWRDTWKDSVMKAATDRDGKFKGYTFNNTNDSVEAGYRVLARQIGLREFIKSESSREPESALV